LELKQINALTR